VDAFRDAFNEVVRRHEIWRSTFQLIDDKPMQLVHPAASYDIPVIDLSHEPLAEAERDATRVAAEEARRPFDLEHGPLLRPLLVRFSVDHHRLYLAMHHLVFDALSLYRVVLPELIALYDAYTVGRSSPLPSPAAQYADYALWEHSEEARGESEAALAYWRNRLRDAPTVQLPLDHPRPAQQRFRGAMEAVHVSKEVADQLEALSREAGATLFQTIACAFSVLLHRYSGQEDLVFGTVVDLRQRPEFEDMVGFCLTPLVIRADLRGDPTFVQLLGRVREDVINAMDHRIPFQRLVSDLHPSRDATANPIFQTMVMLEPPTVAADPAWSLHPMEVELGNQIGHSKWDLYLELDRRPEGHITGRLIYNTDLFEQDTARRAVGHWNTLLDGIVEGSTKPISRLPLMTEDEWSQVLLEWNATDVKYPRDSCLHDLVSAQVQRSPHARAVVDRQESLSYADLDDRASRLAQYLRGLGVGADVLVGICLDRSVDMMTSLLAVLKAGGAFVPLEPDQPRERLALMISDARPTVILTTSELRGIATSPSARVVLVDGDRPTWMQEQPVSVSASNPTDLAYVLYTSGSTGQPKGVMIEHRSIVNQLVWRVGAFGLNPGDRVLQKTPLGFDVSLWELFCPLICGATVVMLEPGAQSDPRAIAAAIRTERITALHFVPSMLQTFLDAVGAEGFDAVRLVATSGEALSVGLAQRFLECVGPEVALINLYGPTEAAVDATWWRCQRGEATVPIGRPIANTQVYLLDARLHPVPVGVSAELCIGGVGVARGYLNRPDLTAERFLTSPFGTDERIYRTGDLARWSNDGALEYLGRNDDQVKIRGNRVEPGEVEAAIMASPSVRRVAVLARRDTQGDLSLVAYVVADPVEHPHLSADLRILLQASLPTYMVPSAFMTLEALPVTPSGKLDRKALPDPDYRGDEFVSPGNELEEFLSELFAEVLRLERVGTTDDFFELGGHSLLAVRLLREVEIKLGVRVPLASIFQESATVAGMAAVIAASRDDQAPAETIVPVQSRGTAPVLFFIYPDESALLTLRHFVGPLGPEQRVMGLLPERQGRRFDRSRDIENLATSMLGTIRATQPRGPYLLAGYSLGGLIAYEIAGQLQADEEKVVWLGVLDAALGQNVYQRELWSHSPRGFVTRVLQIGPWQAAQSARKLVWRWLRAPLVGRRWVLPVNDDFDYRGATLIAANYSARGHEASMDLFTSADNVEATGSPTLGWENVHRGPITLHAIPGKHLSVLTEPNVRIVAETLSARIRHALAADRIRAT
jgi:amino acid adenylation domain-containing protein